MSGKCQSSHTKMSKDDLFGQFIDFFSGHLCDDTSYYVIVIKSFECTCTVRKIYIKNYIYFSFSIKTEKFTKYLNL